MMLRLPVALLASLTASVTAQELLWIATGVPYRQLGTFQIAGVGDVNHDGYEDLLAIVDGECGATRGSRGYLWLLSGRDGTLLREVPSDSFYVQFVSIGAAGDMDGDGTPDYVDCQVGTSAAGTGFWTTEVRSGVDDAVLWSVPDNWDELLGDLDVDGDGQKDLVVGDDYASNGLGEVRVHAHGGALLYRLVGDVSATASPPLAIGYGLANLGDVDDDGGDDFAMACFEPTGRGAVVVVSGRNGNYLRTCYGELPGDGIGYNVDSCGDLDGDGYQDIVSGNGGGYFIGRGVVRAFSSRTGQVLHQWVWPPPSEFFSRSIASRGVDFDGDGIPDVLVGQPGHYNGTQLQGAVRAYSGRDGSALHIMQSLPPQTFPSNYIGYWLTVLRPPVGEHTGFLVVSNPVSYHYPFLTPPYCLHPRGSILAYRGIPRTAQMLGPACAGTLPLPANIGMRSLDANGVRVHLSSAPPNSPATLLLGLSTTQFLGVPLPAALDPFGFPGCALRTSIELMCTTTTGGTGNDAGYAFLDVAQPIPATGNGTWSVSAQWLVLGDVSTFPGGLTQAITWRR